MAQIARDVGAQVLDTKFHSFGEGHGFSGAVILAESHVTIHTWPAERFAAIDFFTCGELIDPSRARGAIEELLGSRRSEGFTILRGTGSLGDDHRPRAHAGSWATEGDGTLALSLRHRGKNYQGQSGRRESLEIIHNNYFGKVLLKGGEILLTENDYRFFSEAQVHPLFFAGRLIRRVLILGGGDGSLLLEVLKHKSVREVTVVDGDSRVSEICKKEFPEFRKAFNDRRVKLVVGDGAEYLSKAPAGIDLLIVDFSAAQDSVGDIYEIPTLKRMQSLLSKDGLLLLQVGSLKEAGAAGVSLRRSVLKAFPKAARATKKHLHPMLFAAPSAATGNWVSLLVSNRALDPVKEFKESACKSWLKSAKTLVFDEAVHRAVFSGAKWVREVFS